MYRLSEMMTMFNLPERTIRRHLSEGILTGKKVGGTWRFDDEDVQRYLNHPIMVNTIVKNNLKEIIDYVNGVSKYRGQGMLLMEIPKSDPEISKRWTDRVNQIESPFYFNIGYKKSKSLLTFIGDNDWLKKMIDFAGEDNG